MPDLAVTELPPAPLHAMEIWSDPRGVAARCETTLGVTLPAMGGIAARNGLTLIRLEPTVWWVEGDPMPLAAVLGSEGALTAIGGGIARVRVAGPGWRTLLMEGGLFDAESPSFAPGRVAATIIDHVAVRLLVESEVSCLAYVAASYAPGLVEFWRAAIPTLDLAYAR